MNRKLKKIILLTSLVLIATAIVGGTFAYLSMKTGDVVNKFTPAEVPIEVEEDFTGATKSNVKIKNNGNIPAYIRATYVVNWVNQAGEIYGIPPVEGMDYTVQWPTELYWNRIDNYYYTYEIPAGEVTPIFIEECTPVAGRAPEGYFLRVDILAQSVQSQPNTAIYELWGVAVGQLPKPTNP